MEKTHWKALVNTDYIGAYCITNDTTLRITGVAKRLVKGPDGKEEQCTVISLDGSKPFICNRTNAKTIAKIYNTPYVEDWIGKTITLFPTTTRAFGETVECLRIRPVKPKAKDYTREIQSLRDCQTLEALQATYLAFPADAKTATVTIKDECKQKLSKRNTEDML